MNSNTPKDSPHHKVGETVTVTEEDQKYTMVVNSVQVKKDARSGDTYLVVNLSATNTGSTQIDPNFVDFSLVDANNYTAVPDGLASVEMQQIFGGKVQPGGKISGSLAFEVKPDQHKFTMTYLSGVLVSTSNRYGWDLQV